MTPIVVVTALAFSLSSRIDQYLTRTVPFGFSGTVLVADHGRVILKKGYGLADRKRGIRNRADTIYDMGSITKAMTATAIMMLVEEHRIAVDDPLTKYFDHVPADKQSITLAQLLTHTAGIVDLTGGDYDPVSREQLVHDALHAPLVSKPGAEWHYSNAGYSLLAAVIEKVSGRAYETFMRERVFKPAGMRDTGYLLPASKASRVAHTYTTPVDHGTPLERLQRSGGAHWVLLGNGGLLTTADDMLRFWQARLLGAETLKRMYTPRIAINANEQQAYGWHIEGDVVQHGGDAPELGVNAYYESNPAEQSLIVVLANSRENGASTRRAVVPVIRRLMHGESVEVPDVVPSNPATHAGIYKLPDGSTFDVCVDRDHLIIRANGQSAIDALTLQRGDASLAARRDLNAKAAALYPGAEILGTSRRDRGVFMTTIRRGGEVLRFAWSKGEPVPESDDGALPMASPLLSRSPVRHALERVAWRERGGEGFVFYDIFAAAPIHIEFHGEAMTVGAQNSLRNTTFATKPSCALRPIVLPMSSRSSVPHGPTVWPAMPRPWNGSRE